MSKNKRADAAVQKMMQASNGSLDLNSPVFQGQGWAILNALGYTTQTAVDSYGKRHSAKVYTFSGLAMLAPWQRNEIYRLCADVFTTVSRRSHIFSGMKWKIRPSRVLEDEVAMKLKELKWRIDEIGVPMMGDFWTAGKLRAYRQELFSYLGPFQLKHDLSNFDSSLLWWGRALKARMNVSCAEMEDWLNATHRYWRFEADGTLIECKTQGFQDFSSAWATDMVIHGAGAIQPPNKKFDGEYLLPGGSVFHLLSPRVGQMEYYVQLVYGATGFGVQEPVFFYPDQLSVAHYLPSSIVPNGHTPLDAILAEVMRVFGYNHLFNEIANGQQSATKLIFLLEDSLTTPAPPDRANAAPKQTVESADRKEIVINQKAKNKRVRVLPEKGKSIQMIDVGKDEILEMLVADRELTAKVIAQVLGDTANERGEMGGDMIAKAGAEAQAELYHQQAILPLAMRMEYQQTHELLPKKYGSIPTPSGRPIMMEFRYESDLTDAERFTLAKLAMDSRGLSTNEVREGILMREKTSDPKDDVVGGSAAPMPNNQQVLEAVRGIMKTMRR